MEFLLERVQKLTNQRTSIYAACHVCLNLIGILQPGTPIVQNTIVR